MNEDKRILALKSSQAQKILLNTPDDEFGRIVRLAASTLNVAVALITLVDSDKTWHKVRHGTDITDVPRNQSFCTEAIKSANRVMVVPNTQKDQRFSNLLAVTNHPKVRFYAGAPLLSKDGYPIGTLCVLDTFPHHDFLDNEKQILADLASTVMAQIEAITQEQKNQKLVSDKKELIIDNQELKAENEDLAIINEELQHRMGNMYAHVSALVSMMSNTSVNKDLFTKRLRSKISVLAETQTLLAARNWTSVPISQLVDTALAPFRSSTEDKRIIVVLSEDFLVSPRGVFILTLMLNELGTNAVKHGALKTMDGEVIFSCKKRENLEFTWEEKVTTIFEISDNPDGFGTQILEQIVPLDLQGKAEHDITTTGLRYQVTAEPSRICID